MSDTNNTEDAVNTEEKVETTEKAKKKDKKSKGLSMERPANRFASGGYPLFLTMILCFLAMGITAVAVFFSFLRGAERVMVPSVVGKPLFAALQEMQQKELYPKITLKYSDLPGEEGKVLEQDPAAGSIVKAYRQVNLTISRGIALDYMEDYVGQNIESVQEKLQYLFNEKEQAVRLSPVVLQKSEMPEGTVIAQFPPKGTMLDDLRIQLIASSGTKDVTTEVPDFEGMTLQQVLEKMSTTQLVLDFSSTTATGAKEASVISQSGSAMPGSNVPLFSHIEVKMSFPMPEVPEEEDKRELVYGVFTHKLQEYPFPIPVHLECSDNEGNVTEIADFSHPGGEISIPYKAYKGDILSLYVMDSIITQQKIQ